MAKINILLGLQNNDRCRKMASLFESYVLANNIDLGIAMPVYTKGDFDNSVCSKDYKVGIVLEKIGDTPIGQGAIKSWRKENADCRIILLMEDSKIGNGKVKGLYDKGYYDGLFLKDFGREEMFKLLLNDRSKEEAYSYYGLESFVEEDKTKSADINLTAAIPKTGEPVIKAIELDDTKSQFGKYAKYVSSTFEDEVKESEGTEKGAEIAPTENTEDKQANEALETIEEPKVISESSKEETPKEVEDTFKENSLVKESDIPEEKELSESNVKEDTVSDTKTAKEQVIETTAVLPSEPSILEEDEKEEEIKLEFSDTSNVGSSSSVVKQKRKKYYRARKGQHFDVIGNIENEEALVNYIEKIKNGIAKEASRAPKIEYDNIAKIFLSTLEQYAYKKEISLNTALATGTAEAFNNEIFDFVEAEIGTVDEKKTALDMFTRFVWSYGVLDELLAMDDVTDIHVVSFNKIRIKRSGERCSTNVSFYNEAHYSRFIKNLEIRFRSHYTVDDRLTSVFSDRNFSEDSFLRVTIYKGETNSDQLPQLLIRKYNKHKLTIENMIGEKLNYRSAAVLIDAVQSGLGILLCGPASCGSTTLLNAMLEYIPSDKNGVVLQHKDELVSDIHPEIIIQHPVASRTEETGDGTIENISAISMSELAEAALSLDVDYYIVSDVTGDECKYLYGAASQGYVTWASIKATSCADGLSSLIETISSTGGNNIATQAIINTVLNKFNIVVYMEDKKVVSMAYIDDSKKVSDITDIENALKYIPIS